MLKSTDGGFTWTEVDVDGGPAVSLFKASGTVTFKGLYTPTAAAYLDADTLLVGYYVWDYVHGNPAELRFSTFDMSTDTWGAEVPGGPTSSTVANLAMSQRAGDGATVFMYDGQEKVGGVFYDRIFFVVYNAGWGAATPVNALQTGSTDNYTFAGCVPGDGGRTHLFYANPDRFGVLTTTIFQNTLTSANALIGVTQVVDQVKAGNSGPGPWYWGRASVRVVSGVSQLIIGYVADADATLNVAKGTSADMPAFTTDQVSATAINTEGVAVFNIGLTESQGAAGTYQVGFGTSLAVTGSRDLNAWDAPTSISPIPFLEPDTLTPPEIASIANGPGLDSSNGFFSAGFVINTAGAQPE